MAAKSKNKYDVFNWIKDKVIPSCKTLQQSVVCEKLIHNFQEVYNDYELTRLLMLDCVYYENV
jgi:hypothetical protein